MDKNSSSAFYRIYLNVRLMPGMRMVRVPLTAESTASEVVDKCKETLGLDADYSLAADFDGFGKWIVRNLQNPTAFLFQRNNSALRNDCTIW